MQAPAPARAAVGATFKQHFRDTIATHGGVAFAGTINGNISLPGESAVPTPICLSSHLMS